MIERALAIGVAWLKKAARAVALETSRAMLACSVARAAVTRVAKEVDAYAVAGLGQYLWIVIEIASLKLGRFLVDKANLKATALAESAGIGDVGLERSNAHNALVVRV